MKVKLLKKVRKRFEIIHHPKGFTSHGVAYEYNLFELIDCNNRYYSTYTQLGRGEDGTEYCHNERIFNTEKECVEYLKTRIIRILRGEGHLSRRDKMREKLSKKIWYNPNNK